MVDNNNLIKANREEAFLQSVLAGEPLHVAGEKAGFANPQRDAYPLLLQAEVRQKFKRIIRSKGETEGIALCYAYFIEVIRDKKLDRKLRLDAAKFLYSQNMAAPKAVEVADDKAEKDINQMSSQELRAFIEQGEAELAERATPIEDAQDIDNYM